MGRWEPNAPGRLQQAALELFSEQGFDETTVAEIAERAGLTERTFFRHFADKREVLFGGANSLLDLVKRGAADAPADATPLAAAESALLAAGSALQQRPAFARQRRCVIAANAELLERELNKLAAMAETIADALRGRGVAGPTADLTAEIAVAVFKVGFERWTDSQEPCDLTVVLQDLLVDLRAVVGDS